MDPNADSIDPSVTCSDCQAVCCRLTVVVFPSDHIPEWLIHRDEFGTTTLMKNEGGWCAAVDPKTSRCMIYEQRPEICRNYAMGSPGCRDARDKWFGRNAFPTPVTLIGH